MSAHADLGLSLTILGLLVYGLRYYIWKVTIFMCVGVCFWVCGDISFTSFTLTMGYFGVWIPSSLVFLSKFLIYLATLSLLIASSHQKELDFGIWFVLIVLLGSWGLVASSSWGLIYLALELQTLSLLVLLTFQKRTYSSEGALKYLVLGSVFSGLFLLVGVV